MYHSITFGDKNTWDNWRLIPTSRPVFNPPSPKVHMVDSGGLDGVIDLTRSLTGYTLYSNRTGSFEFYVTNGFKDWAVLYSEIANYLHGASMKAILEDDPMYYYEGLFAVNQWKSEKDRSKIVIDYNVYPYKMEDQDSFGNWKWDPFNFRTGVIRNYKNIRIGTAKSVGEVTFNIRKNEKPTVPEFIVKLDKEDTNFEIQWTSSNRVYTVTKSGTYRYPRMVLPPRANNYIRFKGQGTVTINYQGGSL